MKTGGSVQRARTDNQWEEGTPAWLPAPSRCRLTKGGQCELLFRFFSVAESAFFPW